MNIPESGFRIDYFSFLYTLLPLPILCLPSGNLHAVPINTITNKIAADCFFPFVLAFFLLGSCIIYLFLFVIKRNATDNKSMISSELMRKLPIW